MSDFKSFPKPPKKKKKHIPRNPKPTADDHCIICGRPYAHLHEIYFGEKNKKWSVKYGCQVRLCWEHHEGTYGVHGKYGEELDTKLKIQGQIDFEKKFPNLDFFSIMGKNYL